MVFSLDNLSNHFTGQVVQFLTGQFIPKHISNLPLEFLSTPFGASLRPMIDQMYRRVPVAVAGPTFHSFQLPFLRAENIEEIVQISELDIRCKCLCNLTDSSEKVRKLVESKSFSDLMNQICNVL